MLSSSWEQNIQTLIFRKFRSIRATVFALLLARRRWKRILYLLLKKADPADCTLDKSLHESEHSIEVMVPFIQVVFPKAKIVPVVVGSQDMETCIRFGQALAKVLKNKKALIVASSDLSHYPSAEDANIVDRETLAAIAGLDPAAFRATVQAHRDKNIPNLGYERLR